MLFGGWYYQQFLKIGFSRSSYAGEYYLIWDADTLPTSSLRFFNEAGQMLIAQKEEYHTPYFETMQRLIGLGKEVDFSFIAEHMLIQSSVMRELIDVFEQYEAESDKPWWQKVIDATPKDQGLSFSEFETYGTYCHHYHPDLYAYRRLHTFRRAGKLFGRLMHDYEIEEFRGVTDTISLEAGHIPHFPRNLYQYLQLAFLRLLRP
jgi:hypothetical protein